MVLNYAAKDWRSQMSDFVQRAATWTARRFCSEFEIETAQTLGPASALLRFARSFPADLTIVHTEIPIWAAQHLIRDGRKVAVDVEDWYSEDLLFADRQSRPIDVLRRAEGLRAAARRLRVGHGAKHGRCAGGRLPLRPAAGHPQQFPRSSPIPGPTSRLAPVRPASSGFPKPSGPARAGVVLRGVGPNHPSQRSLPPR
ncbi:MAG: hypothetical protein WDM96_04230 [Lacunisphaera sp.]